MGQQNQMYYCSCRSFVCVVKAMCLSYKKYTCASCIFKNIPQALSHRPGFLLDQTHLKVENAITYPLDNQ
jgi:hypothetical protein